MTAEDLVPIAVKDLAKSIRPQRTVLLFGAGSSIPSGGPPVAKIIASIATDFGLEPNGYNLREISSLAEDRPGGRPKLIKGLRKMCADLKPTGGLRNLPLYPWKSIFTTNYDNLIEESYRQRKLQARQISSNFDFQADETNYAVEVFKLHGTIEKDVVDGNSSRIIITDGDYSQTEQYREHLYDRMKGDMAGADLLIVGHSLADEDIRLVVDRATAINAQLLRPSNISLLLYTEDTNRASLYEKRGMLVAFGGIDEVFAALAQSASLETKSSEIENPLDVAPSLGPITIDGRHAVNLPCDLSAMFNGRPASYADISGQNTFRREVAEQIANYFESEQTLTATLLGASGVGKTTAARRAALLLRSKGLRSGNISPTTPLTKQDGPTSQTTSRQSRT